MFNIKIDEDVDLYCSYSFKKGEVLKYLYHVVRRDYSYSTYFQSDTYGVVELGDDDYTIILNSQ